jgi:hypothetical protein
MYEIRSWGATNQITGAVRSSLKSVVRRFGNLAACLLLPLRSTPSTTQLVHVRAHSRDNAICEKIAYECFLPTRMGILQLFRIQGRLRRVETIFTFSSISVKNSPIPMIFTIEHSQFHRLCKQKIKKIKSNQNQLENREKLKPLLVFQLS